MREKPSFESMEALDRGAKAYRARQRRAALDRQRELDRERAAASEDRCSECGRVEGDAHRPECSQHVAP